MIEVEYTINLWVRVHQPVIAVFTTEHARGAFFRLVQFLLYWPALQTMAAQRSLITVRLVLSFSLIGKLIWDRVCVVCSLLASICLNRL